MPCAKVQTRVDTIIRRWQPEMVEHVLYAGVQLYGHTIANSPGIEGGSENFYSSPQDVGDQKTKGTRT